ncbi:hypothetical protein [Cohnella sp. GbtcB17]|uniref:hypothetical protein n=1 Tax=Cohnella sp. GbtcB17 TaxID=2824762 RepID=UPI001C2F9ACE|nr:hypothetical protein [Cohnella sp. GbtcB17]
MNPKSVFNGQLRYLFHYYESKTGPFKNLSALTVSEAQHIMKDLKKDNAVFASKRAEDYLLIRFDLEQRARAAFIQKGGKATKQYPHYMTLGPCNWLKDWYVEGKELKIPIEAFNPESLSFTYGDLFPTMRYNDGKPYRGNVYTLSEIQEIIQRYGWPQEWNHDGAHGPERYIEVQVWDDDAIQHYLGAQS